MFKKGEHSASSIATLIAIIVAFMILYLLLIPQEDREELLYGNETKYDKGKVVGENILFSEFLGELSPVKRAENLTHDIASVNLFSSSKKDILTLSNAISVSKGFFTTKSQNLMFELDSPEDVEDAQIYILVGKSIGNLIIRLNGNVIYNKDLEDNTQEIIKLPLDYLVKQNTLELISSRPKFIFGTNIHEIKYVKLRKQYNIKNRVAERVFSVPTNELKYVEKAILSYSVYCNLEESNILNIFLNDNLIFSDVPFCNLRSEDIEVDGSYLRPGPNSLKFETDGDYICEGIELKTITSEEKVPEYYFDIEKEDYKEVARGIKDVIASFDFSVRNDRKIMDLYVNERKIRIDTSKNYYYVTISDYVEADDNLVRIEPMNTFDVVEFKIEIS